MGSTGMATGPGGAGGRPCPVCAGVSRCRAAPGPALTPLRAGQGPRSPRRRAGMRAWPWPRPGPRPRLPAGSSSSCSTPPSTGSRRGTWPCTTGTVPSRSSVPRVAPPWAPSGSPPGFAPVLLLLPSPRAEPACAGLSEPSAASPASPSSLPFSH